MCGASRDYHPPRCGCPTCRLSKCHNPSHQLAECRTDASGSELPRRLLATADAFHAICLSFSAETRQVGDCDGRRRKAEGTGARSFYLGRMPETRTQRLPPRIAALSHTLPDRLIEQTTPWSASNRGNCSLVYWLPRSGLPRRQLAITKASVTSWAVISALIDQPHDASGEQIDHRSDVEPAFRRPHVGKVCNPFAIGRDTTKKAYRSS